jgi:succinyl-CoA synthetase (ADP-forming) alpha subunit (EC 6.2.1.5)
LKTTRETKYLVVIGEIGGDQEERLANLVREGKITKPIAAFIAGRTAPLGRGLACWGDNINGGLAHMRVR